MQCAFPDGDQFCPGNHWFSLAVLPDAQSYDAKVGNATMFDCQTEWLKANAGLHKGGVNHEGIKYVLDEGDIVTSNNDMNWARGKRALCVLRKDNGDPYVPYTLALGNMDDPNAVDHECYKYFPLKFAEPDCLDCTGNAQGPEPPAICTQCSCAPSPTACSAVFPAPAPNYQNAPCAADQGSYNERNEATFRTFNAAGYDWLVLAIRWGASTEALKWAGKVANTHPTYKVVILTHDFLNPTTDIFPTPPGGTPTTQPQTPQSRDGANIWQYVVQGNPNVAYTFNAHNYPERGRFRSFQNGNTTVWSMFSNFQQYVTTQFAGAFEMVSICPSNGKVAVRHYSPYLDKCIPNSPTPAATDPCWTHNPQNCDIDVYNYDIPPTCGDGWEAVNQNGVSELCDAGAGPYECCASNCMSVSAQNTTCEHDSNACTHGTCDGQGNCNEPCNGTCSGGCGSPGCSWHGSGASRTCSCQ